MSHTDNTETTNTGQALEPFQSGLCNCGCGAKLEENGGLLNQDGTRRRFIKYHHLKSGNASNVNRARPGRHKRKNTITTERKEIRELKMAVKELRAQVSTMETRSSSRIVPPPFEARPVHSPSTPTPTPTPKSTKNPLMLAIVEMLKNSRMPLRIDDMVRKACESNPELKYCITDGLRNENGIYTMGGNKKLRVFHSELTKNPNIMVVGIRPAMLMWVSPSAPAQQPQQQPEQHKGPEATLPIGEYHEIIEKNSMIARLVEENRKLMQEMRELEHQLEFNRDAAETAARQQEQEQEQEQQKQTQLDKWDEYSISNKRSREKSTLF